MKDYIFLLLLTFLLNSCVSIYEPIVHVNKYYAPVQSAIIVTEAPANSTYIGTIKTVPHDNSHPFADDINKAKSVLLQAAAEAGAKYIILTNYQKPTSDYHSHIDYEYGDGITLEAEMYR